MASRERKLQETSRANSKLTRKTAKANLREESEANTTPHVPGGRGQAGRYAAGATAKWQALAPSGEKGARDREAEAREGEKGGRITIQWTCPNVHARIHRKKRTEQKKK